jgi:hypothetical protein
MRRHDEPPTELLELYEQRKIEATEIHVRAGKTLMPRWSDSWTRNHPRCRGCGISKRPVPPEMLCEVCRAAGRLGMSWRVVYDRASGDGAIPANLLRDYPELRR